MALPFWPTITLSGLDSIDESIQQEHLAWVKKNVPVCIDPQLENEHYSILNYPELWSGARFFETEITTTVDKKSASEEITQLIAKAKKDHPEQEEEIKAFEKKYTKYLTTLKERSLLKAIHQTLDSIDCPEESEKDFALIRAEFRKVLDTSSLLNMQTRYECLQAHKDITLQCYALRDKANSDPHTKEKVQQLEILSKRLLDIHYEGAKKMTITDAIAQDVATTTSFIGLATAIPAAILGIMGFAFPPLLVPAGILGSISFVSYTSTVISAIKMAHEAIGYGRGPNPSDVKWFVADVLLSPLNLAGGLIFAKLANSFRSLKAKSIINTVSDVWNNVVSNIFPDTVETKEVASDMLEVGSVFTAKGQLKNTVTATSWQKMRSILAASDGEAVTKVMDTKEKITLLNQGKQRLSRSKEYRENYEELRTLLSKVDDEPLLEALEAYINLEEVQTSVDKNRYALEAQAKILALEKIVTLCDSQQTNPVNNTIKKLAVKLDEHIIKNYSGFESLRETVAYGRDFAYVRPNGKEQENSLPVTKSYHGHILLWDLGFKGLQTSDQAKKIKNAIMDYKQLKPDCGITDRIKALETIHLYCQEYLDPCNGNQAKGRYRYVQDLSTNVTKELDNLRELAAESDPESPVLVGFKAR
ncbi:hypothetical protein [Legionella micdadei]|uniref:Uncharacterized protein n=1 Tax=Legionella micdadei TaxID=451 RepID=A0A098GEW1_LEGMI|nr:hypothetical protein [Legionella micdadei]ARG97504.1 hypothetical protein B6N58_07405 [Legionella micdadei]KTD28403.1 hypothetical protein Lmic_1514 [Legionella micdadei]NSL17030.1 hypothetical protein [Legionella micdadei]CEG61004.1 membrane protein of unknown function [coiled-coil domain] [Legionella micdadei]SCY70304.1 hypothetical protein SAMN02982997_02572 [Legionella micdadei]